MKLSNIFKRKSKKEGKELSNKNTIKREGITPKRINSDRTISNKTIADKFKMTTKDVNNLINKKILKTKNGRVTVKSAWLYWYENLKGGGQTFWEKTLL